MKVKFVHTRNIAEFWNIASKLKNVEAGVPGMGLVFGLKGRGKTTAAINYCKNRQNNAFYVRAKKRWKYQWMMKDLMTGLRLPLVRGEKAQFDAVVNALVEDPRLIVIDESNHIKPDCLESLRDIHDMTNNPILFIGHEGIRDKFAAYGPFNDRLLYVTEFKALNMADLRMVTEQFLEIPVEFDVLESIHKLTNGQIRKCIINLKRLEDKAIASDSPKIVIDHFSKIKKAA